MTEPIIDQAMKSQASMLEGIVRDAFRQHFGFPLDDVKDTENLECCVALGYDLRAYRYRKHTFLLVDEKATFEFNDNGTCNFTGSIALKYLPV